MLAAWRKIGAFPLTRACLAHPKVRSVAGGQGPDSGKLEDLAKQHKQNQTAVTAAGFNNTFRGTVPTHTHVARPSSEEEQIAELVRLGSISTKNLWVVCGASAFNSGVVMKAQAAILAKAGEATAAAADAAALELMEAELGAAAAKAKRGGKDDSTLSGSELAVVVKFVHLKNSKKGWSSYSSKKERVAYLSTPTPAWTELVLCDQPTTPPAPLPSPLRLPPLQPPPLI